MEDIEEVRKTNNWELYQHSVNYMSTLDLYEDSDRNYRMTAEEAKEYRMIDSVLVRK